MKFATLIFSFLILLVAEGSFSSIHVDEMGLPVAERYDPELIDGHNLYSIMQLGSVGLSYQAFDLALKGMKQLYASGHISRADILSIADLSQSSCRKRLYVIDLKNRKILFQTYVAHGRNSGEEYAQSFSNQPSSYKTSLGFYSTLGTYNGKHGLSLQLKGEERGINDHAYDRAIVMHGAPYVCSSFIQQTGRLGRSEGCPAVPVEECEPIVNSVKNGTCFFVYYPDRNYLLQSSLL